jgi:carbon-monoxide dehydrogenase medium subunit
MIPVSFDYVRPTSLEDAIALLAQAQPGEAEVLAGGQSLITRLKSREARPRLVVDIGGLEALRQIEVVGDVIALGAMVTQSGLLRHPFVRERLPLLGETGAEAADPMVRNRGTLVGALCEIDPAGDWVAAALVLDTVVHISGPSWSRSSPLAAFVTGAHAPALQPGELVTSVSIAAPPVGAQVAYRKRNHGGLGWSVASAAVTLVPDRECRCAQARVAVSGAAAWPQRVPELELALQGVDLRDHAAIVAATASRVPADVLISDRRASAVYRAEALAVLLRRTLVELAGRAVATQTDANAAGRTPPR